MFIVLVLNITSYYKMLSVSICIPNCKNISILAIFNLEKDRKLPNIFWQMFDILPFKFVHFFIIWLLFLLQIGSEWFLKKVRFSSHSSSVCQKFQTYVLEHHSKLTKISHAISMFCTKLLVLEILYSCVKQFQISIEDVWFIYFSKLTCVK